MNNADFQKDSPPSQWLGKEFIIVIVVVFSALSFTLGYFVGKSNEERRPLARPESLEVTPPPQNQAALMPPSPPQSAPVAEKAPAAVEAKTETPSTKTKAPLLIVEEKQPAPAPAARPKTKEPPAAQGKSQQLPAEKTAAKADKTEVSPAQDSTSAETTLYTVQLGAFRSLAEARACKKKYSQKDLKISITTSTNDKKEKVYKVRAGEFRDRKKAEMLSLRLNKTGKLKTYITSLDK